MFHPKVIVAPVTEPISLAEAVEWCRLDNEDSTNVLESIITGGRELFENDLGYTFHETTLEMAYDYWPCGRALTLPRATPLVSVTSVTLVDENAAETTWDASEYRLDTYSTPGRIYLPSSGSWPSVVLDQFNGIRVRYVAGKVTQSPEVPFPEAIRMAMRLIVAHWNENREATTISTLMQSEVLKMGVAECLRRFEIPAF